MARKRGKAKKFKRRTPGKCPFCEHGVEPDYKDVKTLATFMSDKGKITARSRSGACQKHQRALSQAIKRARYMSLLPHVTVLR